MRPKLPWFGCSDGYAEHRAKLGERSRHLADRDPDPEGDLLVAAPGPPQAIQDGVAWSIAREQELLLPQPARAVGKPAKVRRCRRHRVRCPLEWKRVRDARAAGRLVLALER